ncbi:MAG: hypothetical protein ACREH5_05975 [Candidatus Omnitrophota bacterium]
MDDTGEPIGEDAEGRPVLSQPSEKLRLRNTVFIAAAAKGEPVLLLKDAWTFYKGRLSRYYPALFITAEERPRSIRGRGTVRIGASGQREADDFMRQRLEAGSRAIYQKVITKADNIVFPRDRMAAPHEYTVVKDMNGFKVVSNPNPNIADFVLEQRMIHEATLNAMAADAILPSQSLTDASGETATATRQRDALFKNRVGLTFDIYADGERGATWWYFEYIKQVYLEGKQDAFEAGLFGITSLQKKDFQLEDLLLDVTFEIQPFAAIAKSEIDRLLAADDFKLILPILQRGPGAVLDAELLMIENYWRNSRKPEKLIQRILKPYKDALANQERFNNPPVNLDGLNDASATPLGRGAGALNGG